MGRTIYRFKLLQDGYEVASGSGPDKDFIEGEGWHYAKMYAQDGPVDLKFSFTPKRGFGDNARGD